MALWISLYPNVTLAIVAVMGLISTVYSGVAEPYQWRADATLNIAVHAFSLSVKGQKDTKFRLLERARRGSGAGRGRNGRADRGWPGRGGQRQASAACGCARPCVSGASRMRLGAVRLPIWMGSTSEGISGVSKNKNRVAGRPGPRRWGAVADLEQPAHHQPRFT